MCVSSKVASTKKLVEYVFKNVYFYCIFEPQGEVLEMLSTGKGFLRVYKAKFLLLLKK